MEGRTTVKRPGKAGYSAEYHRVEPFRWNRSARARTVFSSILTRETEPVRRRFATGKRLYDHRSEFFSPTTTNPTEVTHCSKAPSHRTTKAPAPPSPPLSRPQPAAAAESSLVALRSNITHQTITGSCFVNRCGTSAATSSYTVCVVECTHSHIRRNGFGGKTKAIRETDPKKKDGFLEFHTISLGIVEFAFGCQSRTTSRERTAHFDSSRRLRNWIRAYGQRHCWTIAQL